MFNLGRPTASWQLRSLVCRGLRKPNTEKEAHGVPRVPFFAFLSVAVTCLVGAAQAESDKRADVIAPPSRRLEESTTVIIVAQGRKAADVISFDGFDVSVTVLVNAILNDSV